MSYLTTQSLQDEVSIPVVAVGLTHRQLNFNVKKLAEEEGNLKNLIVAVDSNVIDHETRMLASESSIASILNLSATELDTFKEVGDYITQTRSTLDAILENSLTSTATTLALTAAQGKILKDAQDVIDTSLTTAESDIAAIEADYLTSSDIINDLTTGGTADVLSAQQGVALKALIDGASSVVVNDTLGSTSSTEALSANQGKIVNDKVLAIEGDYLTSVNIIDGLVSTSLADALSAAQGKVLNDRLTQEEGNVDNLEVDVSGLKSHVGYNNVLGNGDSLTFSATGVKGVYSELANISLNLPASAATNGHFIKISNQFNSSITIKESDGTTDADLFIEYNGGFESYGSNVLKGGFALTFNSTASKYIVS